MKFLKVLCALMLLLTGSNAFSFSPGIFSDDNVNLEQYSTSTIEEGSDFSYDMSLSIQINLNKVQFTFFNYQSFKFLSSHKERIAKEYFNFSCLIDPNLGIAEIIFPFHSFL